MWLWVGRLHQEHEAPARAYLQSQATIWQQQWSDCSEEIAVFELFNFASLDLFLRHAADLAGFAGQDQLLARDYFPNLPWFMFDVWLPAPLVPSQNPPLASSHWPIFIGSAPGLVADLAKMKSLSHLALGTAPSLYAAMRRDFDHFQKTRTKIENYDDVIRWIWLGLHDGATLAMQCNTPMFAAD